MFKNKAWSFISSHMPNIAPHTPWDSATRFLIKTCWTGQLVKRISFLKRQHGSKIFHSCLVNKKQGKPMLARQSLALKTHQWNFVKEALEDHYTQKTLMNQTCNPSYKRCHCLLSPLSPSLHHNINMIPNWIKTPQCSYFLVSSDSNCNALSYLPLLYIALKHTWGFLYKTRQLQFTL